MTRGVSGSIIRLAIVVLCAPCIVASQDGASSRVSPQTALNELLTADRGFSEASAHTDLIAGLSAMFADDVAMPIPGNQLVEGRAKVIEALRSNADNAKSRIEWVPVRGGVSGDGQHGFTLGYMTLHGPDATKTPLKYLAYWVKRAEGWRVVAYKRSRRAEGQVSLEPMTPALPARMVSPAADTNVITAFRESLDQTERAFSRDAQRIGIGAAFAQYCSADAINMGGATDAGFVVGSENIGRMVAAHAPATGSAVSWAPDKVIVASSGDLGVTIGWIHPNAAAADGTRAPGFPFFTIWRRASATGAWRYIAE